MNEASTQARWYVVHTYSGYENKVKTSLEKAIENRGMSSYFFGFFSALGAGASVFFVSATDAWAVSATFFSLSAITSFLLFASYLVSLCSVCLRQNLQYFLSSSLSGSFFLFFIVS